MKNSILGSTSSGKEGIPVTEISTSVPGPPEVGLMAIIGIGRPSSCESNSVCAKALRLENGIKDKTNKMKIVLNTANFGEFHLYLNFQYE
jgi:hypothetical protein